MYFSSDSGATWTLRNGTVPNNLTGPNGAQTINTAFFSPNIVAAVEGNGVFYTSDGGNNWFKATGLPAGADPIGGIFSLPTSTTAYVVIDGAGIYKSTDNGVTWTPETTLFNGVPASDSAWCSAKAPGLTIGRSRTRASTRAPTAAR